MFKGFFNNTVLMSGAVLSVFKYSLIHSSLQPYGVEGIVSVSQMVKLKPGDVILIICLRCCRWPVAEPGFTPGLLAAQPRFSTTHLTAPASRQLTLRTQSTQTNRKKPLVTSDSEHVIC